MTQSLKPANLRKPDVDQSARVQSTPMIFDLSKPVDGKELPAFSYNNYDTFYTPGAKGIDGLLNKIFHSFQPRWNFYGSSSQIDKKGFNCQGIK